jgi:very-short-patch-repair endonuclease
MREREEKTRFFARQLRKRMTKAEVILWVHLRRIPDAHFRKQHPIGQYIADFACVSAKLVVEVDGATHGSEEERDYDRTRDAYMHELGWTVIRVTNTDVYCNLDGVLRRVWAGVPLPSRATRAPPPPQAGEDK